MAGSTRFIAAAAMSFIAIHAGSASAASFTFTPLVLPNSNDPAYVTGVYQDQAIGWGSTSGTEAGFVWSAGNYTLLPSIRPSVSDNGLVVGYPSSSSYSIYNLASGTTNTYNFGPANVDPYSLVINSSGTIAATEVITVQHGRHSKIYCRPFVQDTNGTVTYLTDSDKPELIVTGLTDSGTVIAASSSCPYQVYDVFINKNGTFKPFHITGGYGIQAFFVNGNGLFGGNYDSQTQSAGFTSKGGKLVVYAFPGALATEVTGIDSHGNAAGSFSDSSDGLHGFIYANKTYHKLDVPGHKYTTIIGFSTTGAIIGYFGDTNANGQQPNQPFIATCSSGAGCTK